MVRKISYFFFLVFLVTGCGKGDEATHSHGGEASHSHGEHKCAPCQEGQAGGTVWCDSCKMGFIEGKTTTDKAAVEAALKAATPAEAPAAATCAGCSKAKADCTCHGDGETAATCAGCSKAKAECTCHGDGETAATCAGCSKPKAECTCHGHDHEEGACSCAAGKAGGTTWCAHCGSGYIKGVKSKDKAAVEAALKAAEPAPATTCAGCSKAKADCDCH